MSRIGKLPVSLPDKVSVEVLPGNVVKVKGPLGELTQKVDPDIKVTIEDNEMIGFRDKKFDEMFGGREAFADYLVQLDRDACLKLFEEYKAMDAQNY